MKIGLRLFYNPSWMGGVNYVLNWARALRALPAGERPQVTLLTATPAAQRLAEAHSELGDAIAPFQQAARLGLDFVYPATQLAEAPFGVPWAGWIPDWQCRHMPDLFSTGEATRRLLQYRVLARQAPLCVVSSHMADEDTSGLFPDAQTPRRVLRFPAVFADDVYTRGEERIAETRKRLGAPARYVIVCNQFWRHKNHLIALEALARASEPDVHLVMSGALADDRWPDYVSQVRASLARPDIAKRTTMLGPIDREDQIDLMLGALGVLQPSRFEGWSTVVEEARALGLPSLLSEIPVHREQDPPGAAFFDANEADALAAQLDSWFSASPQRLPRSAAREQQQQYVAACAESFMAIANEARARYDERVHDPKPITAHALVDLRADREAGRIDAAAEALFQANARALFREHPEELAALGGYIGRDGYPLYPEAMSMMILASLAKMSAEARQRFFDAELGGDAAEFASTRRAIASPTGLMSLSVIAAAAKTRAFVREKLKL